MHKLRSRKLWTAGVSAMLVLLNNKLGLDLPQEALLGFTAIVVGYLASQGLVDARAHGKPPELQGTDGQTSLNAQTHVTQGG